MDEQQKNIDDIFRQSLGDYREVPPAAAWDKVVAKLDGDDNRRRGAFLRWPWTMMVLLLFLGGAWFALTLYGRWTRADHSTENAVAHTNTHGNGGKQPSPAPSPVTDDPPAPAVDQLEAPGDEASPAITSARQSRSVANEQPAPAREEASSISRSPYSGTPAKTARRRTAAKAQAVGNTTTEIEPTTTAAQSVMPDGAAIEHAPLATRRPRIQKTTVYGKMIVTEEVPDNLAEADAAPVATPLVGTTQTAAQKTTSASGQNGLTDAAITSTPSQPGQPGAVTSNAATARRTTPLGGVKPQVARPEKKGVALKGKTAVHSEEIAQEAKTQQSETSSSTGSETVRAATPKKRAQIGKPNMTFTAPAAPTAIATAPATLATAAATPKSSHSAPVLQNAGKKDPSLTPAKPIASAPAKPATKARAIGKDMPTDPSLKGKQSGNQHDVMPSAIPPPAGMPVAGNAKKGARKAKPDAAANVTYVAEKTPVKATGSLLPLSAKRTLFATNDPALTAPVFASTLPAAHVKPQTAGVVAAKAPLTSTSSNAAAGPAADTTSTVTKAKYPKSFSLAALAGYEFGMQEPAPGRVAGGARFLLHVGPKTAIGLQPAVRYGTVSTQTLSKEKSYQNSVINVEKFTSLAFSPSIRNSVDTLYHYVVRETFDSIVVGTASAGGKSFEFELPLIINYQVSKAWHVYGGPSLNLGGKLTVTDPTIQKFTVTRKDSLVQSLPMPQSEFVNYFGKSSLEPYSNYQPSSYLQDPASLRLGYILGLGYDWKRIMFDASLHQQLSGFNDVAQPFRKVYSSPYLRLSVGYMLFPPRKSQKNEME